MMRLGQHRSLRRWRPRAVRWIEADTACFVAIAAAVVLFFLFNGPRLFSGNDEPVRICFAQHCHDLGRGDR